MQTLAPPTLDDLLRSFLALTEGAKRACATEDMTALIGALDAREVVGASLVAFGRSPKAKQPVSAGTRRLMSDAMKASGELETQFRSARDEIRRQLERISLDEAAIAGYAGAAPRANRVDV